jgi:bacteriochlorophyll 4-vinyl reductase
MTEARVGRLLAACLHQAILDVIPQRLEFYEYWLDGDGIRDGIGLAGATAVIGFLRAEAGDTYDRVMDRAGRLAAAWTLDTVPSLRRRMVGWLPRPMRARSALKLSAGVVRVVFADSRAVTRVRGRVATVDVKDSLFCAVREPRSSPLCQFYFAAIAEALERLGIPATGHVERCRAVDGAATCRVTLELFSVAGEKGPAIAA